MKHNILRLSVCVLLAFIGISAFAQVTVEIKDLPLTDALKRLEEQSGYSFFYSNALPDRNTPVSVKAHDKDITYVMDRILEGLDVSYELKSDKQIALYAKPQDSKTNSLSRVVTGVVRDTDGYPVIGAGVIVVGQTYGTVTDENGKWTLELDNGDVDLEFSAMGYQAVTLSTKGKNEMTVVMSTDTQFLDEVVVVGYGTQKKVNLTGSVSMVSSDDMASRPSSSLASGLQGMLPGVTVVNSSGQPGASNTTIRVRGIGTIGNANPLILIDGVEGDISAVNPEDIESVSVLKDAASAAIYGARAANGVLLVTTKKTQSSGSERTKVTFGAYFGFQTPTCLPEMCDALEFMTLDNEARANVGTAAAWTDTEFKKVESGSDPNYFANTDWISEVLNRYAPQQSYNLTLSGGVGSSGYMLSYRYFDQDGLTVGSSTGEQRHNIRFKLDILMQTTMQTFLVMS